MKEISTMRISDAITWFLEYHQNTKKFSPKTVEVYNHAFEVFLSYVNSRTMIKNITTEDILSFQKTVSETKKISVGTLNKYSSALRFSFSIF